MPGGSTWLLTEPAEGDIDRLMAWFPDAETTRIWGGPEFRYPFNRHSFAEDMRWGRIASFRLQGPPADLAAFGQLYERFGCIHLARLAVRPDLRGQGVGKHLVNKLMDAGRSMFSCEYFSLFVYRSNEPALACYRAMGFTISDYPADVPHVTVCYYLTRPVKDLERAHAS